MKLLLQVCVAVACLALTAPYCFCKKPVPKLELSIIESVLRKYDNLNTLSICDYLLESSANPGDRYISDLYTVQAEGFKNGGSCQKTKDSHYHDYSKSLVMKVPHENELDTHLFELYIYEHVLPELTKYLPSSDTFEIPKVVHLAPRMILLEDWTKEYKQVDRREPYPLKTLQASLKELAKLHSTSIIMKQKSIGTFNHLTLNLRDHLMNPLKKEKMFGYFNESFEMFKLRSNTKSFVEHNSPNEAELIGNFVKLDPREIFENAYADIKETPEDLEVIVHGEFWQIHMMNANNDLGKILITDLAHLCKSNLVRDLVFIFATSPMTKEDRQKSVDFYVQNLMLLLGQANVDNTTIKKYSTERLMNEIRRLKYFEFFIAAIFAMPTQFIQVPTEDMIKGMSSEEILKFLDKYLKDSYDQRVRRIATNYYDEL